MSRTQRRELEVVAALLALTHDRALAPELEIDLRQLEAIGRRHERLEAGLAVGGGRITDEEAAAGVLASADPAPKLVELGDAEPVGVEHHHHGGVRHIDTDLDDRGGDEDVESPAGTRP